MLMGLLRRSLAILLLVEGSLTDWQLFKRGDIRMFWYIQTAWRSSKRCRLITWRT
ncbi:hypothetical protein Golob_027669, partial [Gossypium lobatum]|nr:hypothetical protein [Gossypium lobatum]